MADDEISLDEEEISLDPPTPTQELQQFFQKPIAEAVDLNKTTMFKPGEFPGPESIEALSETPLAYKEICEPMLRELYLTVEKRKAIDTSEAQLKTEFRNLLGLDRGMIQRGAFGAKATDTKGKTTTDWKKAISDIKEYVKEQIGKESVKEITAIVAKHTKTGEPGMTITPYMVGTGLPPDDEEAPT